MKTRVFIDGKEGTTGLQIYERFQNRNDVEIMLIDEEKRKDVNERAKMINSSDITFLCLPDAAAIEAASLCTNPDVRIILRKHSCLYERINKAYKAACITAWVCNSF